MAQVASIIFKSLGFNGEAHAVHALDNIYDGMIDRRYEIPGKHIYFNGEECILAITYYKSEANETSKPVFWMSVEAIGTSASLCEMCAKSMSEHDIKSTVDKFVKEIKASMSM